MSTVVFFTLTLAVMLAAVAYGVFSWLKYRERKHAEGQRLEYKRRMRLDEMNNAQLREESDRIERELRRGR